MQRNSLLAPTPMHFLRVASLLSAAYLLIAPVPTLGPYVFSNQVDASILYSANLCFAFLVSCFSLGLFCLPVTTKGRVECVVLSVLTGASIISYALLLVGLLGVFSSPSVRWFFYIVLALGNIILWRKPFDLKLSNTRFYLVLLALVVLQACFSLIPTSDFDDAAHQLELARALLNSGYFGVWPNSPPFNYPAAMQLLYSVPLAFGSDAAVRLLTLSFAALTVLGVFSLGARLVSVRFGLAAAIVLASCNIFWELAVTSRVDLGVSVFGFGAIYVFCIAREERKWLPLFYLLAGMAAAIKLTGVLLVLLPVLIATYNNRSLKNVIVATLLFAPAIFFYGRNTIGLGSPIYPGKISSGGISRIEPKLEDGRKLFQAADSYFASRDYSGVKLGPDVEPLAKAFLDSEFKGRATGTMAERWELFFSQGRFSRKVFHYYNLVLWLALLFPLWLPKVRQPLVFAMVFVATMTFGFHLFRYYVPAFPLLALGVASVFEACIRRLKHFKYVALGVLVFCCFIPFYYGYQKWLLIKPQSYLVGELSSLEYLSETGYSYVHKSWPEVLDGLNKGMSDSEKVLLIGESKTFHLQKNFEADYEQQGRYATAWLRYLVSAEGDYEQISRVLAENKVNYLVFNWSYYLFVLNHEPLNSRDRLIYGILELLKFIDTRGEILLENEHYWVVKLL